MIVNEAKWEAGRLRRIEENTRIGGERRFKAANEDADILIDFIHCNVSDAQVARGPHSKPQDIKFIDACWCSLLVFGGLTEKQAQAVRNVMVKREERKAEFRAQNLASQHIGTVGERRDFDLTVSFVTDFQTQFGITNVFGLRDADGNIVIYKGSSALYNTDDQFAVKGDTVKVKATIKEHGERDGVKQTIIARPKQ
jgi:hypothetical protein